MKLMLKLTLAPFIISFESVLENSHHHEKIVTHGNKFEARDDDNKTTPPRKSSKAKSKAIHLKRCWAGDGVFVAAVSAVLDVVAQVVDVDALAVVAVPLELVAALGSFPAPVEKE